MNVDDIGYGLISRELIHRTTGEWHRGGIGVLYLRLTVGTDAAAQVIKEWTHSEPRMYWYAHMGSEYVFFLRRLNRHEKLEALMTSITSEIRSRWQEWRQAMNEAQDEFAFGSSILIPSRSVRSAETMIYDAVKEAMLAARYGIDTQNHAMAVEGRGIEAAEGQGIAAQDRVQAARAEYASSITIGELAAPIPVYDSSTPVSIIARMFERDPKSQGVVIVEGRRPVGILMKEKLHQLLAGQFGLPLYWSRPVSRVMDGEPLIVDSGLPIEQVSQMAMAREFDKLYDVVTITKRDELAGVATIRSILESITKLRTEAARGANPLTGLPGNHGIGREMQRRIRSARPFAVIYADLDYFKWYNDCYGYRKGDEMIRYTAEVIRQVLEFSGAKEDFIGHIGGDDYIVMTEAEDPDTICQHMIWRFDGGVKAMYDGAPIKQVIDRNGHAVEREEGVTISLSLMTWDGLVQVTPELISERAAHLKKQAKAQAGSCYVKASIGYPGMERNEHDTKSNAHS
jgi:diguanylate cyclase (GGDEF)-like protein